MLPERQKLLNIFNGVNFLLSSYSFRMLDIIQTILTFCTAPVSYTHLDVYKRQIYYTGVRGDVGRDISLPYSR